MRLLLIDHYDSFTAILADYFATLVGPPPLILQHDDPDLCSLQESHFDAIVLSPGPGHPGQASDVRYTDRALQTTLPLLGICLGMQVLTHRAGGNVRPTRPWHGRVATVLHNHDPLFDRIPSPFAAARYHSLGCEDLPPDLLPLAHCAEDGTLMALRHRRLPRWGVQYHPESIATAHGHQLLANFLRLAGWTPRSRSPLASPPSPSSASTASSASSALPERGGMGHRILPGAADGLHLYTHHLRGTRRVWLDGALSPGRSRFSLLGDDSGPRALALVHRRGAGTQLSTGAHHPGPLLPLLRTLLRTHACPLPEGLPMGPGLVGYLGYEMRAETASMPLHLPAPAAAEPDAAWLFLDRAIVIDHQEDCTHLLSLDPQDPWLDIPLPAPPARPPGPLPAGAPWDPSALRLRHPWATYTQQIRRCQEALHRGDSYELCLTNQATLPCTPGWTPLESYTWLRRHNPAPHAALLEIVPGQAILSSSPERFLSMNARGEVEARPIKGTRPRHPDPLQDRRLRDSLASAEKDRAENLMITDLLRNDLAQHCEGGSITVSDLFQVESYATLHQLVSVIRGQRRADRDVLDVVWAAFPGGSMTGMPKRRSMEILEALEGGPRGVYSGALGHLSVAGTADLSIVIRALVLRDGQATVGCGGAIVVDSVAEDEVEEARLKLAAVCPVRRPSPGEF